jgi:hypothetical protein
MAPGQRLKQIENFIRENPDCTIGQIAHDCGTSRGNVQMAMQKLRDRDVVQKRKDGRQTRWRIKDKAPEPDPPIDPAPADPDAVGPDHDDWWPEDTPKPGHTTYHVHMARADVLIAIVRDWPERVIVSEATRLSEVVEEFLCAEAPPFIVLGRCDNQGDNGKCLGHREPADA